MKKGKGLFLIFFVKIKNIILNYFKIIKEILLKLFKNKRALFYLIVFIVLIILFSLFIWDISKPLSYDEVRSNGYENIDWNEKADNDGYNNFESAQGCFKWKAVITPPNKSYLFKVLDVSTINIHIKDLEGSIIFPTSSLILKEKDVKYEITDKTVIIRGEDSKEFTLLGKTHFASFLGLNIVSPHQGFLAKINGADLGNTEIQVPNNSKIIKVGDGDNPAAVYKLNNDSYFFHYFSTPAIVYYQKTYHLIFNLIIILFSIAFFIFIVISTKKYLLPVIRMTSKKFLILFIILITTIIFLSNLFPNPHSVVLNWDKRTNIDYDYDKGYVVSDDNVTNYLWWVLAVTRTADAMIIGEASGCYQSRFRYLYLTKFSVQKFIIIDNFEDNACSKMLKDFAPNKTVVVSQEEVINELHTLKKRDYFLKFLFPTNAKLIIIFSNLLLALSTAFLIWKAFNIRKIRDIFVLLFYSIVIFLALIIVFAISGILAHMPIGYHGLSNIGLIMSNYAWPGIFRGGNNLRTLSAIIGCLVAIFFFSNIRKRINLMYYPFACFAFILLLLIPKTEYFTKRVLLTSISAEAYVWDYKLDFLNPLDLYRSLRENNIHNYLREAYDPKTEINSKLNLARSYLTENNYDKPLEIYNDIIKRNDLDDELKSKTYYALGNYYYALGENTHHYDIYLDYYKKALEIAPQSNFSFVLVNRLLQIYKLNQDNESFEKLIIYALDKYSSDRRITYLLEYNLATHYFNNNDFEKTIKIFENSIIKYPYYRSLNKIKFELANLYGRFENFDKELQLYVEIINQDPEKLNVISSIYNRFKNLSYFNDNDVKYINKSLSAFDLEMNAIVRGEAACGKIKSKKIVKTENYLNALKFYNELENTNFSINDIKLYNIFRKAEVQNKLAKNINDHKEKRRYFYSARSTYEKIFNDYPDTYFAALALYRLQNIMPIKKTGEGMTLYYNLGSKNNAFSNSNNAHPRQNMYLPGLYQANLRCYYDRCNFFDIRNSCLKICDTNNFKIKIEAKGQRENENEPWPKMQLYLNKHFITEWKIDNNKFEKFTYDFYLPNNKFDFNIVYPDNLENYSINKGLVISKISINDNKVDLINLPEITDQHILENFNNQDDQLIENKTTLNTIKDYISMTYFKISKKLTPREIIDRNKLPSFKNLYLGNRVASRGMSLYFASILILSILFLLRKEIITISLPITIFMISRGIIRITEHDPIRAWYSILPGFNTGASLAFVFLLLSLIIFIIIKLYQLPKFLLRKIIKQKQK